MNNEKLISWLYEEVSRLVALDETKKYIEKAEKCKEDGSQDYYIGVYEGVFATIRALSDALSGDVEDFDNLIDETEAENLRHWETYEPAEEVED